ncbi:Ring hydroxylating alpha subunit (catalytic domain) [Enhydrobacter aerosaccus]|uniref:Ring hydroxylating alpha subunit (Catalytic domain) n=1 Tax=Enhydrobacter aerosaccus TaxID=225324 RepID=A0A1T4JKL2_9HYPH|nr:aromatic ring-hydroxylating dioxygenase subunit alpha [Enhydrobacter aerosaccus]SJZ30725.1 Ring hydroxylating alpha subunit (catalytic domain) [Enhydrobacter aerosaccus]
MDTYTPSRTRHAVTRTPEVEGLLEQIDRLDEKTAQEKMLPAGCYTSPAFFAFEQAEVFSRTWICVGRVEQVAQPGDCLATEVASEPVLVVRGDDGDIRALSAICRHRGEVIPCAEAGKKVLRCPLHYWTYDFQGRLVGAPRMGDAEAVQRLRQAVRLPSLRLELWHGFIFVNLDEKAAPLAPSLAKLEPLWAGYEATGLKAMPPVMSDTPLPWNWKVHVENFTDAYHTEYVHIGTHDFAPSVLGDDGVRYMDMKPGDNAIVRSVPMRKPGGGMNSGGWSEDSAFPAIATLPPEQRERITFAMLPPSLLLMMAPGTIAYTLIRPAGAEATLAGSDRVTYGGWLLPQSTLDLPDLMERCAAVSAGGSKIWAQDVPMNRGMQASKHSRFSPDGIYGPLETTLPQFNLWLLETYRRAMAG